jgi:hypothetical protein
MKNITMRQLFIRKFLESLAVFRAHQRAVSVDQVLHNMIVRGDHFPAMAPSTKYRYGSYIRSYLCERKYAIAYAEFRALKFELVDDAVTWGKDELYGLAEDIELSMSGRRSKKFRKVEKSTSDVVRVTYGNLSLIFTKNSRFTFLTTGIHIAYDGEKISFK